MRSEDEPAELLETGEIEVVQTELRAAVEGVRPQTRARTEQQYGSRRAAVRKINPANGPVSSASGPLSGPMSQRHHSSLGASVSLGAINQALGAMSTEPAFVDREERPSSRAVVRTPSPSPSPLSQPHSSQPVSRVSPRLQSPTAAMPSPLPPPPPSPPHLRRDEEATMARPISSPPPPLSRANHSNPANRARMPPPAGGIAVPTPFDEMEEQTNAVMPLSVPMETTDEMPTAFQLQTPPTIMAGGSAMPAAFRAQVLQQMQAARAGQSPTAMDAMIAQQLANVHRAQPIAAPEDTQLSVGSPAFAASALALASPTAVAVAAAVAVPMPGAIRPPGSPLSTGNVDPPGTAVTARQKVRFGNPAMSWAAGLLVVGACVGAAVFVMWRNDSRAEAAAQAARSVQAAAAAQQAQMASTGTYLGQAGAAPADPSVVTPPPPPGPQTAPYGGLPANGAAAANVPAPSASTTAAAAALTAAALNDGTTGMGGTLAPGNGTQPVMQLTPAQLAVMTGGAPPAAAPPAATPVAAAPAPAPAANSGAAGGSTDSDGPSSHHHHSHAAVAANDTPAPAPRPAPAPAPIARAAAPAPAPTPKPTPAPKKVAAATAGSDDMDSAAKALAKAQLEQSL